jgi:MFS family permease
MFVSRIIDGLTAGNISTANATVLDRYRREEWAGRFAQLGSATGAGIVIGLLASSAVADRGLGAAALAALGLALASAILTAVLLPETRHVRAQRSVGELRRTLGRSGPRGLRRTVAAAVVSMTVQAGFLVGLPLYLMRTLGYHEQAATTFLAALVGGAAVFQLGVLPWLLRAAGERRSALAGFAAVAAGAALCATANDLPVVVAGAGLAIAGVVTLNPAFSALIGRRGETGDEGALMGINQSAATVGQLLGPLVGYGALAVAATLGFGLVFLILAVLGLAITFTLAA